jgi:hypothetical protein
MAARQQMTNYRILQTIVLGFLSHNDSYDAIFGPETGGHLKFDGKDIIYVDKAGVEQVSHTSNNAIDIWLERKIIEVME